MCSCGQPTINGKPGYKWQPDDAAHVYPVNAPTLYANDVLLYDEPGRCEGVDSHSYHYRVVKSYAWLDLLVRHGAGDERIHLSLYGAQRDILSALDSSARYWLLNALYHAYADGKRLGTDRTADEWRTAAAEKRITTRKVRGTNTVKVYVTIHCKPRKEDCPKCRK